MRRTVLVVEDEGDIRELVRVSLERVGGYRVLSAESGQAALRWLPRSALTMLSCST